jgi:hypothetical protein
VSRSLTCVASIVVVQDSSGAKSASGSSVNVRGPPEATAVCAPLVVQRMSNHEPATATSSLKVRVMFASTATPVAPAAGVVASTRGASSSAVEWKPSPSLEEHDRVVAVEPARAVRLVGLGEDGRDSRAVCEDVDVARGYRARQIDRERAGPAPVEAHLDCVVVRREIDGRSGAVVDLEGLVVARPLDVLGEEELGRLRARAPEREDERDDRCDREESRKKPSPRRGWTRRHG